MCSVSRQALRVSPASFCLNLQASEMKNPEEAGDDKQRIHLRPGSLRGAAPAKLHLLPCDVLVSRPAPVERFFTPAVRHGADGESGQAPWLSGFVVRGRGRRFILRGPGPVLWLCMSLLQDCRCRFAVVACGAKM